MANDDLDLDDDNDLDDDDDGWFDDDVDDVDDDDDDDVARDDNRFVDDDDNDVDDDDDDDDDDMGEPAGQPAPADDDDDGGIGGGGGGGGGGTDTPTVYADDFRPDEDDDDDDEVRVAAFEEEEVDESLDAEIQQLLDDFDAALATPSQTTLPPTTNVPPLPPTHSPTAAATSTPTDSPTFFPSRVAEIGNTLAPQTTTTSSGSGRSSGVVMEVTKEKIDYAAMGGGIIAAVMFAFIAGCLCLKFCRVKKGRSAKWIWTVEEEERDSFNLNGHMNDSEHGDGNAVSNGASFHDAGMNGMVMASKECTDLQLSLEEELLQPALVPPNKASNKKKKSSSKNNKSSRSMMTNGFSDTPPEPQGPRNVV